MKNKLLMRISLFSIMLIAFFSLQLNAQSVPPTCNGQQVQDLAFTQDVAAYQAQYPNYLASGVNWYYYSYMTVTLPFNFCFDGHSYNQLQFSEDATLMFLPYKPGQYYSYPYYYYQRYYGDGNYQKAYLCAMGGLMYNYSYAVGYTGYQIIGSAPNRTAVFEWYNNVVNFNSSNPVTLQIRLSETTGQIVYHYDRCTLGYTYYMDQYVNVYGYWYYAVNIVVCGYDGTLNTVSDDYINVYPPGSGGESQWTPHYSSTNPGPYGGYPAIRTGVQFNQAFSQQGIRLTFGRNQPKLRNVIPVTGSILRKGAIYGGVGDAANHPAVFVKRDAGMPAIKILYRIYGPGAITDFGSKVIYQATDPITNSFEVNPGNITGDSTRYDFTSGTGVCFGVSTGTLDLQTNGSSFSPGVYYADASLNITGVGYDNYELQKFNIALSYDISLAIYKPKKKEDKKYPFDLTPIEMEISNIGINSVTNFDIYCRILYNGTQIGDTMHYEYINTTDSLKPAKSVIINQFPFFFPEMGVGNYEIQAWVILRDATDQDLTSNIVPRAGDVDYEFAISKEVDLRAVKILKPDASNPVTVGKPMLPVARFTNQGVNDVDFDSVFFEIKYNSTNEVVFRDTILNYVITAGARFDTTDVTTIRHFSAPYPGSYQICARLVSPYDENPASWKIACTNFNADAGLMGDYTVGNSGTYKTIQAAVDALYLKGVSGHVRFLLLDRNYSIGDTSNPVAPALDLSAHIPGVGPNATVTFKPSNDRAVERGGVNSGVSIDVLTGSGYGILLGQNWNPFNGLAIVVSQPPSAKNKYSNSAGYFIFDGGQHKSFRFILKTPRTKNLYFHNVFYLKEGAQNNQIKNCIMENQYKDAVGNNLLPHVYIPKVKSQGTQLTFMGNNYVSTTGFSSAIAMRAMAPYDVSQTNQQYNLDTIPCQNNVIEGNEITGFGYGVVDLGQGPLLRAQHNIWVRYYNRNNVIKNNIIADVSRAGIWVGYSENETISGNRIYNVRGDAWSTYMPGGISVSPDAGGILAGGDVESGWYGFNNVGLSISGNEISNVNSPNVAYGIKVEQVKNEYGADNFFPDIPEKTIVMNNIIWGMNQTTMTPSRVGIRLFTERTNISNFLTPKRVDYYTVDDRIFSNTVIMPDDGGATIGSLAGIAVQHSKSTKIMNNAVAIEDNLIASNSPASALIFYQGILPSETHGLESNRNAFWQRNFNTNPEDVSGPAIYGFVEMNVKGEFVDPISAGIYNPNGYETIRQWRNWTGQDMNSVYGNFTTNYEQTGNTVKYLRIVNPRPFGSILNDRGFRLDEYLMDETSGFDKDLLGNNRGNNGQLFDIGAEEFDGRIFLSDVEFQMISSPAAYKSGDSPFNDAEHVMTTLPVKLKVILRNSGNLFQAGIKVRLDLTDLDVNTGWHYYDTVETDIVVAQSKEIEFDIPDDLIKTFAQLKNMNPIIPARFNPTMVPNVTPRYNFKIEVQADENNSNNYGETTIRFYIRKSNSKLMLISSENSCTDVYNLLGPVRTKDEIAGRLNYDYLKDAFEGIGWYPGIEKDILHPGMPLLDTFKIDVFDRNAWEPKAVDYNMYKYVFWSDKDDQNAVSALNQINRYQQWNIENFFEAGATNNKRNFVLASQEAIRNLDFATNDPKYDKNNTKFVNDQLRSMKAGTGYAYGAGNNSNGKIMIGIAVGRDKQEAIQQTPYSSTPFNYGGTQVSDEPPYVGLVSMYTQGEGLAKESYGYKKPDPQLSTASYLSGMTVSTLKKNMVYIGVDWRHMSDPESVLRSVMDYYDKNGGTGIPVELTNFRAEDAGNRVDISWTTASEINSSRFEVERSEMNTSGKGTFYKIADKAAAGTSNIDREYGPIADKNVEYGKTYIYRLKIVDLDGKYEYSDERMVEIGGSGLWLGIPKPNPAVSDVVTFDLLSENNNFEIWLYDMNGKKLTVDYTLTKGSLELNLEGLTSGLYTMILKSGDVMMTRQFQVIK